MGDEFPPKVPCPGACAYGTCSAPGTSAGCGGCCHCMRGCQLEYEVEQVLIPETPEQHRISLEWGRIQATGSGPFPF